MKKNSLVFLLIILCIFLWGCKGGSNSGGGGSSTNSVVSYSSYSDLYTYNASSLDGYTVRWETPIQVYTNRAIYAQECVKGWGWGIPFVFNSSDITVPVTNAISILPGFNLSSNVLGLCRTSYYTSGKIFMAAIYLNVLYLTNPPLSEYPDTLAHEVGHAIGFFGHTSEGGLMDATSAGSSEITSKVRNVISLLYSLPIGTDIRGQLGLKSMPGGRYQPNGTGIITKEFEILIPGAKSK